MATLSFRRGNDPLDFRLLSAGEQDRSTAGEDDRVATAADLVLHVVTVGEGTAQCAKEG